MGWKRQRKSCKPNAKRKKDKKEKIENCKFRLLVRIRVLCYKGRKLTNTLTSSCETYFSVMVHHREGRQEKYLVER